MAKEPVVDQEKCIGCGVCASLAGQTFAIKDGKSRVIDPQGDDQETIKTAIESCPVSAISWKEE